jgi:hypothetical protein
MLAWSDLAVGGGPLPASVAAVSRDTLPTSVTVDASVPITTPILAGVQGVPADGRVTPLGRGGSDLSAVAIAAAIKADRCDIYTDVDGIYTTDPRVVPRARKLEKISFEEMLELASVGAKVLQTRSVDRAGLTREAGEVRGCQKGTPSRGSPPSSAPRWSARSWSRSSSPTPRAPNASTAAG